jgi:metal-responsive CopG/Arc/MetJ family transcriptional regulator
MKELKKLEENKVKISITLSHDLNKRMEYELTNKSKLIEKLLRTYYGNKNLL